MKQPSSTADGASLRQPVSLRPSGLAAARPSPATSRAAEADERRPVVSRAFTGIAPAVYFNPRTPNQDIRLNKSILSCAVGALLLSAACAAQADDDRFTLRLGGIHAQAESQFSAQTVFDGEDYEFESERYELGEKTVPRVEGMFRLGNRHRLLFNYFRYSEDRDYALGEDIVLGDMTIPAGTTAGFDTEFDLGGLVYDFAVVETPTTSIGLQIGAQRAKLAAEVMVDSEGERYTARESENGTAPVVGVRLGFNTQDERWRFVVQGQYLDADWGDFDDYDGDLSRANALVEYRFTEHFGLYAGYDWFKLNVRQSGSDGVVGLDQRFSGPIAGVTFAF
jgi:hypothetical protein